MTSGTARWSGLLVSVRDAEEAGEALAGGAAIVDVKEPDRGPLGAADPRTTAAVARAVGGRARWTLACGELAAAEITGAVVAAEFPPKAAKAGPAGLDLRSWRRAFAGFAATLPRGVEPIAVAYADWRRAAAPAPPDIVDAAADLGCRTLLVDTFDKAAAGVMQGDAAARLPEWIERARAAGLAVAIAGRLGITDVGRAAALGADVVAVRSAVCRGGRLGRVDRVLVAAAAAELAAAALANARG